MGDTTTTAPVATTRPDKKIAIVGFTASKEQAPWSDPSFELWICNNLWKFCPPTWKRLYDLHDLEDIRKDKEHEAFMRGQPQKDAQGKETQLGDRPAYCFEPQPEWPMAVEFPRAEINQNLGRYFTNSISWMIAHALMEGATELHVYGVDMATGSEYCISPDSLVLRHDLEWVKASDIETGDRVVAFDEDHQPAKDRAKRYRRWRTGIVESKAEISRPCYRIKLDDGSELISSQEHRWLSHYNGKTDWVRTDQLWDGGVTADERQAIRAEYALATAGSNKYAEGDQRMTALADRHNTSLSTIQRIISGKNRAPRAKSRIIKPFDVWEKDDSYGAGFLAAAFDGEGHLAPNGRGLGFAQRPNAMAERVEAELDKRGFNWAAHEGKEGTRKYTVKGGRCAIMRFLGTIRPPRLLSRLSLPDEWGSFFGSMGGPSVESLDYIGEQTVIALKTTTGTFIADGFASHNSSQRPSCEYLLGIAVGMGVKVYVPPESDLLKLSAMYGAEDDAPLHAKMLERRRELTERFNVLCSQRDQCNTQIAQLQGALETTNYILDVWTNPRATSRHEEPSEPSPNGKAEVLAPDAAVAA